MGATRAPPRGREGRRADASADRVFISYRRADSGGWARSLHDKLEERLGEGRAFRDVAMEGGVDFVQHVESLLDRCEVLLAIIGKRWASITDADGHRRLDDPDDLVRREIARALQRPDVQVIPVLVDGAHLPTKDELPPDLAPLIQRQACELTDSRWEYDVETLIRRVGDLLGQKPRRLSWAGWPIRVAAVIAILLGGALVLWPALRSEGTPTTRAATLTKPTTDRNLSFGQYLDRKELSRGSYQAAELERRGALVTFDFGIEGYRSERLPLRWQLINAATGDQVAQSRDVAIVPEADDDRGTWDVWVPVPRGARQRYVVQVQLYNSRGDVPIARLRTAKFAGPR
jgi:hypothetical protein